MGAPAICADGVGKLFHRGERHDSLRDLIPSVARKLTGRREAPKVEVGWDQFWAVRHLSFEVQFGRALGIIGPNGAGKSTSLKLLTGILRPTEGEIRMRGRVASLIEVSAGFHPDLTGRENTYLQGAILGMSRRDIDRRFESIVDFAGIGPFIDTPVKRYSSGMNARLGFAIAVHLEPDVLVIDEVLSVGDMAFQQKCVDRMKAFKRDGVAIVFVSHNMQAVGDLCDEALVIKGHPRFVGTVGEAVGKYLELSGLEGASREGYGFLVDRLRLVGADGKDVEAAAPHTELTLEADIRANKSVGAMIWSLRIHRATDGVLVADGSFTSEELGFGALREGDTVRLRFPHNAHLARGQYAYEVNVYDPAEARHRLVCYPAALLRVDEFRSWAGVAAIELEATADLVTAGSATAGMTVAAA